MGPPLGPSGKCCGNGEFLVNPLPAGETAKAVPYAPHYALPPNLSPFHNTPIKSVQPNGFPVGADLCVRPAETSPILIPVRRIRTAPKHAPSSPTYHQFHRPTTGGHIGPPLRPMGKCCGNGGFLVNYCLRVGTVKTVPYAAHSVHLPNPHTPMKFAQSNNSPVGADLCVRPAGTTSILIPLRRIRIISKRIPLLPTQNKFELPTTGGHMGPPLRGEHGAVHKQILRRFG